MRRSVDDCSLAVRKSYGYMMAFDALYAPVKFRWGSMVYSYGRWKGSDESA